MYSRKEQREYRKQKIKEMRLNKLYKNIVAKQKESEYCPEIWQRNSRIKVIS